MEERIILVDRDDCEIGSEEKLKVHREGKLHRAFSIFIFNSAGQVLLQKRAKTKYHSGGLWTNTCCSHQRPGEDLLGAAHRRLKEEMGFDTRLNDIFSFIYQVKFDNGLWEHELDHVLVGFYEGNPEPNPQEADGWEWIDLQALGEDVAENPKKYTYWFREALPRVLALRGAGGG